jgi:hypothetical protein
MKKSLFSRRGRFRIPVNPRAFSLVAAGLALLSQLTAGEPSPMPPDLEAAAQKALKIFLPALDSASMKETHGFAPTDDFKELTLGQPFEPFFLNPAGIGKYAGGKVTDVIEASGSWYFPVRSRDHLACLVSVVKLPEGKLVEERLGMPEVARAWAAINEAWPAGKGYTPIFIIVPSEQRFYFTVPQAEPPNMTLVNIESKDSALAKTYERLMPAGTVFAALRR